jgi:hypothetical protein
LNDKFNISFDQKRFRISPYPALLSDNILQQINHSHKLIVEAIEKIVANYSSDEEIKKILKLSPEIVKIIKIVEKTPYKMGGIRPDFLINNKDGRIKICEINSRFSMNSFILSEFFTKAMSQLISDDQISLIKENNEIVKTIFSRFDLSQPITVIKDKEKGYDVNFLSENVPELKQTPVYLKTPKELSIKEGKIYNGETYCNQFILELKQSEIIGMNRELLSKIVTENNYFNDLRSIFIVHDKRLLVILSDEKIMQKYLAENKVKELKNYVIPTFILNKEIQGKIKNDHEGWVLKKYDSGKGKDMYVCIDKSLDEVKEVIFNKTDYYIAQPFLKQQTISVLNSDKNNQAISEIIKVVGVILIFDKNFLGVGTFRGSQGNIINSLHSGGIILNPVRKAK